MNTSSIALAPPHTPAPAVARSGLRLLESLRVGRLALRLPDGRHLHLGPGGAGQPCAEMQLANWAPFTATWRSGDIGLAETYIAGDWSTPDLSALLQLFLANREALETLVHGHWWGSVLHRLRHLLRRNSRRGSRRNIHAHYDLGNPFYRLWLDPTMNYSSAWFDGRRGQSLADAQQAKVARALGECGIGRGGRLLEIGCGWGAVAQAAAAAGARVTGVTLSSEQLAYARERLRQAGLQAELRLQDYRDIDDPPFDAVVSIEMFEAVGREYWPGFFRRMHEVLRPGGRACVQTITIRDDLFERYARSTDFIQQYVFPGGMLPCPSVFRAEAQRAGFEVVCELAFGDDYAETLRRWRRSFGQSEAQVRAQGFDTRFVRTWDFYLAYCEAAFAAGSTDVMQFTLRRPERSC